MSERRGIFEEIDNWYEDMIIKNHGRTYANHIVAYMRMFQDNKLDNHICVFGAPGVGKSYTTLNMGKVYALSRNEEFSVSDTCMMGYESIDDIIRRWRESEEKFYQLDEASMVLYYLNFMNKDNKKLISAIERLRAKRNILVSCTRDVRRLVNVYRNGRIHTAIMLTDQDIDTCSPIGIVFHASNFFEGEDKFGLDSFFHLKKHEEIYYYAERSPFFAGYFFSFPFILTKKEIGDYEKMKKEQMDWVEKQRGYLDVKKKRPALDEHALDEL